MVEDTNTDDQQLIIEESLIAEKALMEKLRQLTEKYELERVKKYTYLDAIARQGSHVGIPTTRP